MTEYVVLLDEGAQPIGTADKSAVHTRETPLHLAFSCHVYDRSGRMLVTRRALSKRTWPGVWTNAFCGHPAPDEAMESAIARRARHELGIEVREVTVILPDFRYDAVDASGIREYEVCPVYSAVTDDEPKPRADEVAEYQWASGDDVEAAAARAPWLFSPWFGWQLEALATR